MPGPPDGTPEPPSGPVIPPPALRPDIPNDAQHPVNISRFALILGLLSLPLLAGCQAMPIYHAETRAPHKDTVVTRILIETPHSADVYRQIASRELDLVLMRRDIQSPPLYRARFEFVSAVDLKTLHARVFARLVPVLPDAPDPSPADVAYRIIWRTYLY